jgi:hypothetical protein
MTAIRPLFVFLLCAGLLAGCAAGSAQPGAATASPTSPRPEDASAMNRIATSYVKLVLALGQHDPDYVDAYYGPLEQRIEVEAQGRRPLADIRGEATGLLADLKAQPPAPAGPDAELLRLRRDYLGRQLESLIARVDQLGGKKMSFDEESQALYDAVAPRHDEAHFQAIVNQLDAALPGEGPVVDQLDRFRQSFVIQRERLDVVFRAAIDECRARTARHVEMPAGESFVIEYVTGKPWSGYNWYKGGYHSVIQVNTDLPIYIDRAIDLACHEGYPGHHVYNALLEKHLVRDRGWPELSVYALFSPQSLIAEGTANFGIEVAFPGEERIAYEREKLFPLAGLDPTQAGRYYAVQALVQQLSYAGNESARRYLDGELSREQAVDWMKKYALYPQDRAEQRIRFVERYRSYVINYNWGMDLVKTYVERRGGTPDHPEKRWEIFEELLASPRLPSGLR